jgi:hypothetical protein
MRKLPEKARSGFGIIAMLTCFVLFYRRESIGKKAVRNYSPDVDSDSICRHLRPLPV